MIYAMNSKSNRIHVFNSKDEYAEHVEHVGGMWESVYVGKRKFDEKDEERLREKASRNFFGG